MYVLRTRDIWNTHFLYHPQNFRSGDTLTSDLNFALTFPTYEEAQKIGNLSGFLKPHKI